MDGEGVGQDSPNNGQGRGSVRTVPIMDGEGVHQDSPNNGRGRGSVRTVPIMDRGGGPSGQSQ